MHLGQGTSLKAAILSAANNLQDDETIVLVSQAVEHLDAYLEMSGMDLRVEFAESVQEPDAIALYLQVI
jgi:hypothetical protein